MTGIDRLSRAVDDAVAFMVRRQAPDGHWEDYELPVGASDAWVTAYVGMTLASTTDVRREKGVTQSVQQAATWLTETRPYCAGWGFNSRTGPDADTTANALMLLRECGASSVEDADWLLMRWQPNGGFATYASDDAWGEAHPCVTPLAFLALPEHERRRLGADALSFARRMQSPDGTWPSYWWRTCHYSTFWNLVLLRELGVDVSDVSPRVMHEDSKAVHSYFDLACVLGIASVAGRNHALILHLAEELASRQQADGSWEGGANLRVTHHRCHRPWEEPLGELYRDGKGLVTTATAIRTLHMAIGVLQ